MSDWIKVHRRLLDSSVFANPITLKVWIWLLIKANFKDKVIALQTGRGYEDVLVKRGKVLFGRNKSSKELKLSPSSAYRHIKKLSDIGKITVKSNSHYSIITICKYELYQSSKEFTEQLTDSKGTANEQQVIHLTDTSNKDNKEKKDNNSFNTMPIFSDFNGLPDQYQKAAIEVVLHMKQTKIELETVLGMWEVFKVKNLTGKNYYPNEGKFYNHFVEWIKLQKFENGKSNKSNASNHGKSLEFDKA